VKKVVKKVVKRVVKKGVKKREEGRGTPWRSGDPIRMSEAERSRDLRLADWQLWSLST
jgi:hypothetical protein